MGNLSASNCQKNPDKNANDQSSKDLTAPPHCNIDTEARLYKAVKKYLAVKYDSFKLRKIRLLLKSGKYVSNTLNSEKDMIFEIVCRTKPPEHSKMCAQIDSLMYVFKCYGIDLIKRPKQKRRNILNACM